MSLIKSSQFESVLTQGVHLLDVRAPIEFKAGAIPGAVNLPLLSDQERHLVGIEYKEKGQSAAIDLGHKLVCGELKQQRMSQWLGEVTLHPNAIIYCFRGGLRSQTVQGWLADCGVQVPIVQGGYKALRNFLIRSLNERVQKLNFKVVTGMTGAGKTRYLRSSKQPVLDLEALAHHRGSVFGGYETQQTCQVYFENAVALELLKLGNTCQETLVEDESRMIGRCVVPECLFLKMKGSDTLFLEVGLEERVETIFNEYIQNSRLGTHQDVTVFTNFKKSIGLISRKLGGQRTEEILLDINKSETDFGEGVLNSNRVWIRKLLVWYYDPLYTRARVNRL